MSNSTIKTSGDISSKHPNFGKPTAAPMNELYKPTGNTLGGSDVHKPNYKPTSANVKSSADTSPMKTHKD